MDMSFSRVGNGYHLIIAHEIVIYEKERARLKKAYPVSSLMTVRDNLEDTHI
jgi:hypothetical protein